MNWTERNPQIAEALRNYFLAVQKQKPALFTAFKDGSNPQFPFKIDDDKGTGILLFYAALSGFKEDTNLNFLVALFKEYGNDIFRLNKLEFNTLQNFILAYKPLGNHPLREKIPGILRSVCDFFFQYKGLSKWLNRFSQAEKAITPLSQEIYLMGKTSAYQNKPRLFLWLVSQIDIFTWPSAYWVDFKLPVTQNQSRIVFTLGPLKNAKLLPWETPQAKHQYFNVFFQSLFPKNPTIIYSGAEIFLQKEATDYACRIFFASCKKCPLNKICTEAKV